MTRILGISTIIAALALSIYGIVVSVLAARRDDAALARSGRAVAYVNLGLLLVANLAMVYALLARDFSIDYVAQVGSRATPTFITIISLWSALEGSILFWGLVLAGYAASAAWFAGYRLGALGAYANATLLGVSAFFFLLLVGPANPFSAVFPVPADGPGPNPLLQNHILMAVHPPFLYLGYVGMTVPFAFAIGALLSGRLDDTWLRVTRRWTLFAWMFLSLAILFGMWWSYEVLGWGGYWAWDPVENASFLPWLTATAFLHSAMVQERRGMLQVWNLTLIVATFLLTILGTFLTRSGIISSVHAFTQGPIGYYFLGFIVMALVFSLVVLAGRGGELRGEATLDSAASRESAFLVNNLLFAAFTFTVLLGTLFPLVAEWVRGVRVSVGAPFFNRMTVPICVALLFMIGVGPALRWRTTTPAQLKRQFTPPLVAMAAAFIATLAAGVRDVWTLLTFTFAAFALTANVQEFVRGTSARRSAESIGWGKALVHLVRANNRRYGGYVAHIGLVVMAVGIAASSTYKREMAATLRPGETTSFAGYTIRLDGVRAAEEAHRFMVIADVSVLDADGGVRGTMIPRLNYYGGRDEPIATPAVRSRPHNDLYLTLIAFDQAGTSATLTIIVEPLVVWIWIGGLVIGLGALLALLPIRPARRPQRRPVRRPAPVPVEVA